MQAIANHMSIQYFKESTCYPTEETRIYTEGINGRFLDQAVLGGRVELIPEHLRYSRKGVREKVSVYGEKVSVYESIKMMKKAF